MMGNELEKRGQLFFLVGVQKEVFPLSFIDNKTLKQERQWRSAHPASRNIDATEGTKFSKPNLALPDKANQI